MRASRFAPIFRVLPVDRPFTPREITIAKALASVPSLSARAYRSLRSAMGQLDEDAVHAALTDLLTALACDHADCECLLAKDGDPRDRAAIASLANAGEAGSAMLARTFVRWAWRHQRGEDRRSTREIALSKMARSSRSDDGASCQPDGRLESRLPNAPEQDCALLCEESGEGAANDRVLELIFSRSGCSEREADTYVETESRPGREFGNALTVPVRKAASRARGRIRSYLTLRGILSRDDLAVAIEEGDFREEFLAMAG